ncbi:hypothetical protein BN946_scf184370.g5 [Trametes cinnabarina]|uniref:Uncharacterized protein n=1 Tax=Pycnoporus cinnabarinus TaxID=5643 RepID=A0A060SDI6_PYCCI|nr:hypothetical protein BN946_scf184370.g5 [Trametes cinnabarina]
MASDQLTPYASCADGLGFMNYMASDHRSATSLLTPAASICTVSSLGQDDAAGRARAKTMQTKDILKSPQPHRFHLVPSGRRGRGGPEPQDHGAGAGGRWSDLCKHSTQWNVGLHSPGLSGDSDAEIRGDGCGDGDMFSPAASPLAPAPESGSAVRTPPMPATTQSPYIEAPVDHPMNAPHVIADRFLAENALSPSPVLIQSRPTSICSASSSQTTSSITLVHDHGSKRFSTASGASSSKDIDRKERLLPYPGSPILELENVCMVPEGAVVEGAEVFPDVATQSRDAPSLPVAQDAGNDERPPAITQTKSSSLESIISQYHRLPDKLESPQRKHRKASASTSIIPSPAHEADHRATGGRGSSPTKPSGAGGAGGKRDRRKFALRRQAIYAEYGFQIALPPDPDSSSAAVKVLRPSPSPSPSKSVKGAHSGASAGGRAASAYSALPSSGSVSRLAMSAASASISASSSLGAGLDALAAGRSESTRDPFVEAHGGLTHANDRLERLSVQDDILGATRHPILDDDDDADALGSGMFTSTPSAKVRSVTARARDAERRSLSSGAAPGFLDSDHATLGSHHSGDLSWSGTAGRLAGDASQTDWTPLRITPQARKAAPRGCAAPSLSVGRSERGARLSVWDVDPGHHPVVQELLEEVERAIEQWRWILHMRVYV